MAVEKPIIFSEPMVKAILEGRKTQTRRPLKYSTEFKGTYNPSYIDAHKNDKGWARICPYGRLGDRLWVRETWRPAHFSQDGFLYKADYVSPEIERWKPSIHMPRRASRITLKITGIRVEKLQDISVKDALAEGIEYRTINCPRMEFAQLWNSIYGESAWFKNPWVWVISFAREVE